MGHFFDTDQEDIGSIADAMLDVFLSDMAEAQQGLAYGAIRIGKTRTDVNRFAEIFGIGRRTLELRLFGERLSARELLARALVIHSAWRREHLGWTIKKAAGAGGFSDRDAFSSFVRRNGQTTAGRLANPGSFERQLTLFVLMFTASLHTPPKPKTR